MVGFSFFRILELAMKITVHAECAKIKKLRKGHMVYFFFVAVEVVKLLFENSGVRIGFNPFKKCARHKLLFVWLVSKEAPLIAGISSLYCLKLLIVLVCIIISKRGEFQHFVEQGIPYQLHHAGQFKVMLLMGRRIGG